MTSIADLEVNTDHAMIAASPKTEGLKVNKEVLKPRPLASSADLE